MRLSKFLLMLFLFNSYAFASGNRGVNSIPTHNSESSAINVLYSSDKTDVNTGAFRGYVIVKDELYINLAVYVKKPSSEKHILKYSNGKLIDMNLSQEEAGNYFEQANPTYDFDSEDNKIVIDDQKYIKLGPDHNPRIFLVEGKKERFLKGYVFSTPNYMYMYLDKTNEKLYFAGGSATDGGILIYDIKNGNVNNFILEPKQPKAANYYQETVQNFERYLNPIRVPNTPYLLFFIEKRVDNKYFYEIAIKEITEWKVEMESQKKK